MKGLRALVTAGPTYEPIDPVRFIANRSSGKQGYAIARALAKRGAEVSLISGPTNLPDPPGLSTIHVESAREMLAAVQACLPVTIGVFCAAVVDWRVETIQDQKIKKTDNGKVPTLTLVPNPDILRTISQAGPKRPKLVVGFAAETENVIANAQAKRRSKGCDWIIANDVSPGTGIFGGDSNVVHLISADGVEDWMRLSKDEVGDRLAERIDRVLAKATQS